MNYDVIVTCAVTGAGDTRDKNPHVPVTRPLPRQRLARLSPISMSATQTQPKGHAMSIYSAKPSI
jgi:hypothetical protein